MVLLWIYRKFAECRLNAPPFCADKAKCNGSFCEPKFDDTNNLELSKDFSNPMKKVPAFQKKRVFYFSPNYFSRDESSTVDSMYKFYLKSSNKNYSSNKVDSNHYNISKTDEDERSVSSCQEGKCNVLETLSPEKYLTNRTDLEKQPKKDVSNQHWVSPLFSQALDISYFYLAFPFYVTKMIFDCDNVGYYNVNYQYTSALNAKSPDTDIYSVDDLTFENFCLQETDEKIKEPPCNLLPKSEADDIKCNDNFDQKHGSFTSEVYKPYYKLKSETTENMNVTSDLFETKYAGSKSDEWIIVDQSFKYIQADKANDSDITANGEKFESSLQLDKYDFSLSKLFRKLMAMHRIKPEHKLAGSIPDW